MNLRVGVLVAAALTLLIAYQADATIWFVVYHMAGSLTAVLLARRCRKRADVVKLGVAAGIAQMIVAPIVVTLTGSSDIGLATLLSFALVSGLMAGLLASASLPLLERGFEEMTNMRLLELASADNPVLKDLALHAPGTYYHSILIANLAEAAGEAIGANPLRCRVKALYHRIGEAMRPNAFNENLRSRNVLNRLPPNLAVRVAVAPIRDGIEIARKNRFGQMIVNAVSQQHGTMLIKPIYLRALDEARASGTMVNEDDYRYPGPKPQTKPAGILMLATLVEAVIRALKNPSEENIRARIDKAVEEAVQDGQLDECPLTVQDLQLIAEAFQRVLALSADQLRSDERSEMSLRDAAMRLEAANRHDENGNSTVHPMPTVARRSS